jgi:hypothetical protein
MASQVMCINKSVPVPRGLSIAIALPEKLSEVEEDSLSKLCVGALVNCRYIALTGSNVITFKAIRIIVIKFLKYILVADFIPFIIL